MINKEQLLNSAYDFVYSKIDEYFAAKNANIINDFLVAKVKKAAYNKLSRCEEKLEGAWDWITDKDGNVNIGEFDEPALKDMFEQMPLRQKGIITYGQGKIVITIPDNAFTDFICGDEKEIALGWKDIEEFKELLKNKEITV